MLLVVRIAPYQCQLNIETCSQVILLFEPVMCAHEGYLWILLNVDEKGRVTHQLHKHDWWQLKWW